MIGKINNTFCKKWEVCSRQQFEQLTQSAEVRDIINKVRTESKRHKSKLPAFIFCGEADEALYAQYLKHCEQSGEKPAGSRAEPFLRPNGLFLMDFDRKEGAPGELFGSFLQAMKAADIPVKGLLALAHATPGGHGLRLVLKGRKGSTIEADQHWISQLMHEPIDEVCKDFSRLSYVPMAEEIYYVDEDMLFGEGFPDIYENTKLWKEPAETETATPVAAPIALPALDASLTAHPELLVKALEEQLGGAPTHGSRNNFIFSMACHLRYLFGNDPERLKQLLPTYGEDPSRVWSTIKSACQRCQPQQMPNLVQRAIDVAVSRQKTQGALTEAGLHASQPPRMPERKPALIELLTSKVPDAYKPAVAHAVFPALGAHLGGVKFRYIDNVEHEATFMCCLFAQMSGGKSCVNKPIELILEDIQQRDAETRRREQEWKDEVNSMGSNKAKPRRPDGLCVQVLSADMTNAAFVKRLQDAGDKFLFTTMDELDMLDQLKTSSRGNQATQIIRLAFDCGYYGQERIGTASVTARVQVRWNWNASSTLVRGRKYFQNSISDGTVSRINFCTIVPHDDGEMPRIGLYDDAFKEALAPYIANLNKAHGLVECPEAEALAEALRQENDLLANLSDNEAFRGMSYRANVIAYLKAMTLYVANGMQWSDEMEDFIRWSEQYDLWCKMRFFGKKFQEEIEQERNIPVFSTNNMLSLLPDRFTRADIIEVRRAQGMNPNPTQMLGTWVNRGYILKDEATGEYLKSERFLKRAA